MSGGEHREQRGDVAAARGGKKGVDHFPLAGDVCVGNRVRSLHPAPGAARELPCRRRGAPHDGGDLFEGHGEHVVQHERDPLGGSQGFEDHEHRGTDRVGEQRLVLGIARHRLGHVLVPGLFAPRLPRAQHGYPAYFVLLLGIWKILGGLAILAPRLPLLKEWAYAGIAFDLSGAAVSHAAIGHPVAKVILPLVILGIAAASWALRPASRRLGAAMDEPALMVGGTGLIHGLSPDPGHN